jgi:hypothetical protein
LGQRPYKTLFVIGVEGRKTEPAYFAIFNDDRTNVMLKCVPGKDGNSPPQVLKRMRSVLAKEKLHKGDETWLVVHRDHWTDEQLQEAHSWACESPAHGFAVSNPKFEYWLLLHFDDGHNITNVRTCDERLERHLPGYGKSLDARRITYEMILLAVQRAKKRDNPPCTDWPRSPGGTTVNILVDRILRSKNDVVDDSPPRVS